MSRKKQLRNVTRQHFSERHPCFRKQFFWLFFFWTSQYWFESYCYEHSISIIIINNGILMLIMTVIYRNRPTLYVLNKAICFGISSKVRTIVSNWFLKSFSNLKLAYLCELHLTVLQRAKEWFGLNRIKMPIPRMNGTAANERKIDLNDYNSVYIRLFWLFH